MANKKAITSGYNFLFTKESLRKRNRVRLSSPIVYREPFTGASAGPGRRSPMRGMASGGDEALSCASLSTRHMQHRRRPQAAATPDASSSSRAGRAWARAVAPAASSISRCESSSSHTGSAWAQAAVVAPAARWREQRRRRPCSRCAARSGARRSSWPSRHRRVAAGLHAGELELHRPEQGRPSRHSQR